MMIEQDRGVGREELGGGSAVVMALCLGGVRVGCAVYKQEKCVIECFEIYVGLQAVLECEALVGRNGRDVVPGMVHQFPPSMRWLMGFFRVYDVSVLIPDTGAEILEGLVNVYGNGKIMKLAKSAFVAESVVERLMRMYPGTTDEAWAVRLDGKHKVMLRALSALLHLTSNVMSNVINVVETGDPSALFVEDHTSLFLQLVRKESHPCDYQGVGRAKEGLSLFTVLNRNQSVLGETKLRQWFAFPSRNPTEIEERQEVVCCFTKSAQQHVLNLLRSALHRVHPTEAVFNLLRSGKATTFHYRRLVDTIEHYLLIFDLLLPFGEKLSFVMKLLGSFNPSPLREMVEMIRHTFVGMSGFRSDVESNGLLSRSSYSNSGCMKDVSEARRCRDLNHDDVVVKPASELPRNHFINSSIPRIQPGADPTGLLDELRARLSEMHLSLDQKGEEIQHRLQHPYNCLFPVKCVYLSHPYGYLVSVEKSSLLRLHEDCASLKGLKNEKEYPSVESNESDYSYLLRCLEKQCQLFFHHEEQVPSQNQDGRTKPHFPARAEKGSSSVMLFFKSPEMLQLDEYVGDLQERIKLREAEIRWEIDRLLVLHSLYLIPPSDYIAELDCLLSFAYASQLHSWTKPHIVREPGKFLIRNGWHPILGSAIGRGEVIPFSLQIKNPEDRICLILGANGSGKSVLLSAVALVAFMAQLGCFVPAEYVEMSIMGSILAASPIPTEDTKSSFFAECSSLGRTLAYCEADRCAFVQACEHGGSSSDSSLILVDEFGKGTAPEDGRALLGSILRYFAGLQSFSPSAQEPSGGMAGAASTTAAAHQVWRPIVLCATHLVEILDYTRDLDMHRYAPLAVFPFELVQIFDMQSAIVLQKKNAMETLSNKSCGQGNDETSPQSAGFGDSAATATEKHKVTLLNRRSMIPVDIIPTYIPQCITNQKKASHEENYFSYFKSLESCSRGGLSLGRHCGLAPWLQRCWEDTFCIVKGLKNTETH